MKGALSLSGRVITLLVGLLLLAAPSHLELSSMDSLACWIFGPLVAAVSIVSMSETLRQVRWLNIMNASALFTAGALFAENEEIRAFFFVAALIIAASALLPSPLRYNYGGGWTALLTGYFSQSREGL